MKIRRPFIFPVVALGFLALEPACLADKKAQISFFTPPVQNYAVIDLCGSTVANPVSLIALNDGNQVAFAFPTGTPPVWVGANDAQFHIYTWSNGKLSEEKIVDCYKPTNWSHDHWPSFQEIIRYSFYRLTATGWLYGSKSSMNGNFSNDYSTIAYTQGDPPSSEDSPSPPYQHVEANDHDNIGISVRNVFEDGIVTGNIRAAPLGSSVHSDCYFILNNGAYTIFDSNQTYGGTTIPNNVRIVPSAFIPNIANVKGQAVGSILPTVNAMLWDGRDLRTIGPGAAGGINNQGQVIVSGYDPQAVVNPEGYFWEGGSLELRNTLPFYYRWQVWNIQPCSLSNQVKPNTVLPPYAPDPTADATFHIIADADGFDVGAYRKTLWTRDNQGRWSYATIALPEGTIIDKWNSINSSGVIAAISHEGRALLLLPTTIEVKKSGADKPPINGLAIVNGGNIEIKLNDIPQDKMIVPKDNIKWFSQQLRIDGSYTDWEDMGLNARGVKFTYGCSKSGVFRLKCELTAGSQKVAVNFVRDHNEIRGTDLLGITAYMGPGRKGMPNNFGVCDTQMQLQMRDTALSYLGSNAYAFGSAVPAEYGFPPYSALITDKCNIFVAHRAVQAGALVPKIEGLLQQYPPSANDNAVREFDHQVLIGFTPYVAESASWVTKTHEKATFCPAF